MKEKRYLRVNKLIEKSCAEVDRFAFNGQEKDQEWLGGNATIFKYRIHDPRIGRFLSVDPLAADYPWYSTYQFAGNTPIWAIDIEGAEPRFTNDGTLVYDVQKGQGPTQIAKDLQDNYSGTLTANGDVTWQQIVFNNEAHFSNISGDKYDINNEAYNHLNLNEGDALDISFVMGGTSPSPTPKPSPTPAPSPTPDNQGGSNIINDGVAALKKVNKVIGIANAIAANSTYAKGLIAASALSKDGKFQAMYKGVLKTCKSGFHGNKYVSGSLVKTAKIDFAAKASKGSQISKWTGRVAKFGTVFAGGATLYQYGFDDNYGFQSFDIPLEKEVALGADGAMIYVGTIWPVGTAVSAGYFLLLRDKL